MQKHDHLLKNFRMMPGVKQIFRTGRWLRSRFSKGALILLYHRVAQPDFDQFSLCVTPENFIGHMEYLRNYANPISLQEVSNSLETCEFPRRAVVITFDDGYADNFFNAQPILEKYRIPATFFIISGCVDQVFWWEDLIQIIYQPVSLPTQLNLTIENRNYAWQKSRADNISSRRNLFKSLYHILRSMPPEYREQFLKELKIWSCIAKDHWHDRRPLKTNELLALASNDHLEIGAHTVSHPRLANLTSSGQEYEIIQSKVCLEKLLKRPVNSFSYSYGLKSDYNKTTSTIVKEAGFKLACSNFADLAWRKSDRYQLPRLWVNNWDKATFARRLNRWLSS